MPSFESEPVSADSVAAEAACWVLRHDRGLSPEEQDEFSQWLATDSRRREAFATHRWGWEELDRLVGIQTTLHANPDPDLLEPPRRRPQPRRATWFGSLALAAAAAVAVVFYFARFHAAISPSAVAALIPQIEQRTLDDGSVVELNRGAAIEVAFTADERRVTLVHGEANFQVAKDKNRPFIVSAGGVDVHAIGTAFNVRLGSRDVEVLVTEGRVGVQGPDATAAVAPLQLGAGEHTVLPRASSPLATATATETAVHTTPLIALLTPSQVAEKLRWQPRLLDFTDQPLAEIVAEFNHHNPVRLALGDSALHDVHLSATFRSDNVQGFVRLMVSDFGMTVEHGATADELVLRQAR